MPEDRYGALRLEVHMRNDGVRFYGNREFFRMLADECSRLAACVDGGHCEFQTLSLTNGGPAKAEETIYRVFSYSETDPQSASEIDTESVDFILMTIEDDQFSSAQPAARNPS